MFGSFSGMLFDIGVINQPTIIIFFVLFFLFIIVAYKLVKMLMRAAIIAAISGAFPVFANIFLGMSIPITVQSLLWFAMTGVEIYFLYHILVDIGKIGRFLMKPFGRGRKTKVVEKVIIKERTKDRHGKED